jgi:hypothetical protein
MMVWPKELCVMMNSQELNKVGRWQNDRGFIAIAAIAFAGLIMAMSIGFATASAARFDFEKGDSFLLVLR